MAWIESVWQLLLVVLGFGFLIFVHELGHFLAAKWAGVRVLGFALGFGNAALSYRKGLGWRRGSSENEYYRLVQKQRAEGTALSPTLAAGVSPTEYRLNWLPLGGYVKMLGQVDADPSQTSSEPDGYQRCPVWKRMVIISAGVVANIITAGVLFMLVFKVGLLTEPATIGYVAPGSPASRAVVVSGDAGGRAGLQPGDVVRSVQGKGPQSFNDVSMAVAMTRRGTPVLIEVDRPGTGVLSLDVKAEEGRATRLMEIGIAPPQSTTLLSVAATDRAAFDAALAQAGAAGVEPGMKLVRAGAISHATSASALTAAAEASGGKPFDAEFESASGLRTTVELKPVARLQDGFVPLTGPTDLTTIRHLLGLAPVLTVGASPDSLDRQGLQDHDIFARLGAVEYPSIAEGIAEIRRHRGKRIETTVLRLQPDGSRTLVRLDPPPLVRAEGGGRIGFAADDSRDLGTWLALPPAKIMATPQSKLEDAAAPAARAIVTLPGSRVVAIEGSPVVNFTDIREGLKNATRDASARGEGARVRVTIAPPSAPNAPPHEPDEVVWSLSAGDVRALHALAWASPLSEALFLPEQIKLKAKGPLDALAMGVRETRRVMVMTYMTFARLFDGTVQIEHLKGPVGIAHIGTRILDRGIIWLFFFMALISVNLAVINFLPLPIVDGGQFIFLCIEAIRGKPAPVALQNAASLAGLILIGTMFVIVTFHDVINLFG